MVHILNAPGYVGEDTKEEIAGGIDDMGFYIWYVLHVSFYCLCLQVRCI